MPIGDHCQTALASQFWSHPPCRFLWALSQTTLLSPLPARCHKMSLCQACPFPVLVARFVFRRVAVASWIFRDVLIDEFSKYGEVKDVFLKPNCESGRPWVRKTPLLEIWRDVPGGKIYFCKHRQRMQKIMFNEIMFIYLYSECFTNPQLCCVMLSVRYTARDPIQIVMFAAEVQWMDLLICQRESLQEKNGTVSPMFWVHHWENLQDMPERDGNI